MKKKVATDAGRVVVPDGHGFRRVERLPLTPVLDSNGRPQTIEELRRIRRAAKRRAGR